MPTLPPAARQPVPRSGHGRQRGSGRTPGRTQRKRPPPSLWPDRRRRRRHRPPAHPWLQQCCRPPGQKPGLRSGARVESRQGQPARQPGARYAQAAGPSGRHWPPVSGHHGAVPGIGVPGEGRKSIGGTPKGVRAFSGACCGRGTSCADQRIPAMRGMASLRRDCCGRGSRWASFSRSMVRPRWMRERTVPSFTPRASATSS